MNRLLQQRLDRPEAAEVIRWRFDRLIGAGYDAENASILAGRIQIDLHAAVDLVQRGCPPETAVRILI